MRCRESVFALCVSLLGAVPLLAVPPEESLLLRSKWVQPEIIDGRLVVMNQRAGQGRITQRGDGEESAKQVLALECDETRLSLHYQAADDDGGAWILDVHNEREVTLQRTLPAQGREIALRQPRAGCLTLTIRETSGLRTYTAPTLWHLLLGRDEACRETVAGALDGLWPALNIGVRTHDVRESLVRQSQRPAVDAHEQWQGWVADLSSEEFAVRRFADGQLRGRADPY